MGAVFRNPGGPLRRFGVLKRAAHERGASAGALRRADFRRNLDNDRSNQ